jgi:endonuclease/exonuclease/phosphatase (EEP) superfamily protein YafD
MTALVAGLAPGCASRNYPDPARPALRLDRPTAAAPFPRSLRIVTFNIEHGRRVEAAIAALRSHPDLREADLLFLQEMTGTGVEAVAAALSLAAAYYPASNRDGRDSGCAVLSRWPIERSWKVPLPHQSRTTGESRAAVGARITIGDRAVRAYSVHISSRFALTPGQRTDQVETVLADVASSQEPVILAGDLNGHGIGRHFERAGFTWVSRDAGPSLMGFSIDHVFVRGLPGMTAWSGVAREVRDASDHRPVWAMLAFSH